MSKARITKQVINNITRYNLYKKSFWIFWLPVGFTINLDEAKEWKQKIENGEDKEITVDE